MEHFTRCLTVLADDAVATKNFDHRPVAGAPAMIATASLCACAGTNGCCHLDGIGFCGISPILTAHLVDDEISVSVVSRETYWDTILDLDALPKHVPRGYTCDLCLEEHRRTFQSLEALWCDHLFEPFLQWVNDDLAKAEAISISSTPDWVGWARLVRRPSG